MLKLIGVVALAAMAGLAGAQAQTFPSRQITLVVPFPPGGSTDTAARIMAEKMRPILGQPVIIENVGGAGGSIAVGRVARAAPDGYTIDIGQWDTHVGSIIYNLNYDLQKDFEPIGLISVNPQLMVAQEEPAGQQAQRAGRLDEGQSGRGQVRQPERRRAGHRHPDAAADRHQGDLHSLSRRGPGDDRSGLGPGRPAGGRRARSTLPQVRAGTIKAIANLSPQRSASMPDIPTSDETGVPGLYMSGWFGFWAPKGTPKDVDRQAQRRDGAGARRSGGQGAVRRARPRRRVARAADAGRARGVPEGRDREVVADHQGRRHQGE